MLYFIAWAVFLVLCIIALPVASMMDKRQAANAMSALDDSQFGQDEFEDQGELEAVAEEGVIAEDDGFPAEEVAEAAEGVLDDFSAFDEEFK